MKTFLLFFLIGLSFSMMAQESKLSGVDGPYLLGDSLYYVNAENDLVRKKWKKGKSLHVFVNNEDQDQFSFRLAKKIRPEKESYPLPEKMIVISDIEGNFNAFQSFLLSNNVIDKEYNWTFGNGHLVLVGDFVDRGKNVTAVLWLIYHMEQEAIKHDGKVHFILGNHEVMNLQGDIRYANEKYKAVAHKISPFLSEQGAFVQLFSRDSELGKWMRSKNVIERLGPYIFVHAGLSSDIKKLKISMRQMNQKMRYYIDRIDYNYEYADKHIPFLFGNTSPIWYRGLVMEMKNYGKANALALDIVLDHLKGQKVVIGHTVVKDVCTDYDGKVIKIDLKHGTSKNSGVTKGLLVENGVEYVVDDLGKKVRLSH